MSSVPATQIIEKLNFDELLSTLQESMTGWPGMEKSDVDEVVQWAKTQYGDFLRHVEIVDDPDEMPTSLARAYVHWLSTWYALNTQTNYQLMRGQVCDPRDQWRGMAISALAGSVGDLIPDESRQSLHNVVTTPA